MDYLKKELEGFDAQKVDVYIDYLKKIKSEKKADGSPKNPWMKHKSDPELVSYFKKVAMDGLYFDGVNITLQSTGVSYNYIAYKNRMYIVYPESLIDISLVYKDDMFKFEKHSGSVVYTHSLNNPFNQKEENIIGAYCVIKNKRGQFITLLDKENLDKHRKVAKTDYIWAGWFHEMCIKTVIKKACKQHFADIFQNIEALDNTNYDVDLPLGISIEDKQAVEKITTLEKLKEYWEANSGRNAGVKKDFDKLITLRRNEIKAANIEAANEIFNGDTPPTEQPHQLGD